MKVSNKIFVKIMFLLLILGIIMGMFFLFSNMTYNYGQYQYYTDEYMIEDLLEEDLGNFNWRKHDIDYPDNGVRAEDMESAIELFEYLFRNGYDFNGDGEITREEFIQGQYNLYDSNATHFYGIFKTEFIIMICLSIVLIAVVIIDVVYCIRTNKFIKKIKRYRDYMLSTNKYTIDEISKEFGESIETVELNIEKAINRNILKKVYLSKHTKEILLIDNVSANKTVKGNIQNVNVENNVIISEKGENNN